MTEPQATEIPVREGDVLAGKYRVERVLGVGGMGVVVAAMHAELDQKVAIKVLLPQAAQNPAVIARFSREARAAAKIKSEHVVRVSDVGTMENGLPYIVMEYLEGEDLSQALATKVRLSPGTAVDYVLQACEALAEAHAAGFVHRDLKPGNLFLARGPDGSEIIKVLDFGISKAVIADGEPASARPGSLTRTTDVFGSPLYMSPEQLKSARDVDARADIWALGVILVELISGKSPFERTTIAETFGAILYEKPEPLRKIEGVSPELDAAVMRCLEKDAAARYQNVAELSKALFPFAEHASRQSLDRTSRVLKRAGMTIDTLPPETAGAKSAAATALSPGASTKTSWGAADRAPKPRSARAAMVVGAVLSVVVAGGLFFAITRLAPPKPPPAMPASEPPATAQVTAAPAPTVVPSVMATTVVSAAPSVNPEPKATPSASVTAAPSVVPGPPAPAYSGKPAPVKTAAPPPPATVAPAPPPPATAAPPPPTPPVVKHPEDTNGFGDRK